MPGRLELESTLTDRYQTTVPSAVRRALKLGKRDKVRYTIQPSGMVVLGRASDEDDPALRKFLAFLARDIETHPEHLAGVDSGFLARVQSLVRGVKIDLDAPLSADDE